MNNLTAEDFLKPLPEEPYCIPDPSFARILLGKLQKHRKLYRTREGRSTVIGILAEDHKSHWFVFEYRRPPGDAPTLSDELTAWAYPKKAIALSDLEHAAETGKFPWNRDPAE